MDNLINVCKRIVNMAHQPIPRKGKWQHEMDDYIISWALIRDLKAALREIDNTNVNS